MILEHVIIIFSTLLLVSVVASKISGKMGVPILVFFLGIGMIAGEFSDSVASFATLFRAKSLGTLTLTLVLFSGGLESEFKHIKPVLKSGILLSSLGVVLTAGIVGFFLKWLLPNQITLVEGLLLGSILASTDAAAVFSVLRSQNIKLKANIGPLLELESGSNDVMVYFMMMLFLDILCKGQTSVLYAIFLFLTEMTIGSIGGVLFGILMLYVVNKINLSYSALYPALLLSLVMLAYAVTNSLHGSGFLAVYLAGMYLGNHDYIHRKSLVRFYKGITWLMQIFMFIILGLLVKPNQLIAMLPIGLPLAVVLMFLARPVSVVLALWNSKFKWKEKLFVSWIGLRGAVPIVFATYLYALPSMEKADMMFYLIFFAVLVSVILQGSSLYPLAKLLELENKAALAINSREEKELSDEIHKMPIELTIPANSPVDNCSIVNVRFPRTANIAWIHREQRYLKPKGATILKAHDRLLIMLDKKKALQKVKEVLGIQG